MRFSALLRFPDLPLISPAGRTRPDTYTSSGLLTSSTHCFLAAAGAARHLWTVLRMFAVQDGYVYAAQTSLVRLGPPSTATKSSLPSEV